LLVGQRPQRGFSLLAPRTQPKFAAALLHEPQTWCTGAGRNRVFVAPGSANRSRSPLTVHYFPLAPFSEQREKQETENGPVRAEFFSAEAAERLPHTSVFLGIFRH